MRPPLWILLGLTTLALAACTPVSTFYREGASVNRLIADDTDCAVVAIAKAPVSNQVRRAPPRYVSGGTSCDANGTCVTRPGYFVPGEVFTVDVNAPLRSRVKSQCMFGRGYQLIDLPPCSGSVASSASPFSRLPPLTEQSCAVRARDGTALAVTPGASLGQDG